MFYEKNSPRSSKNYYIGLDIGTDSVGYAVTDTDYALMRHKGEPTWGVNLFDEALLCVDRRTFRTARRRIERRKVRLHLLRELFAKEIAKVDPDFYKRIDESALWDEDRTIPHDFVCQPIMKDAPTIHHLIARLMKSADGVDIRDLYRAVAWLIAHRGHFLNPASAEENDISRFTDNSRNYDAFMQSLDEQGIDRPWDVDDKAFCDILSQDLKITEKLKKLSDLTGITKKTADTADEDCDDENVGLRRYGLLNLFAGGKVKISDLIFGDEFSEISESICLKNPDELEERLPKLGTFGDIIRSAQAVYDCASFGRMLGDKKCISDVKIAQYNTHREDLRKLKDLYKKYLSHDEYKEMFKSRGKGYSQYVGNLKPEKKPDKFDFGKEVKKALDMIKDPSDEDACEIASIDDRIEKGTYMPKQVNIENALIPYQLYYVELCEILKNAENVFDFLSEKDNDGLSVSDKIKSIMTFRVPYYVGPTVRGGDHAWIERKAEGKIYPWNFDKMVDHDRSEDRFIERMINKCTYLPSEDVIPKCSLLYSSFEVLNEINNIKIDGCPIEVETKQRLYKDVFERYAAVKYRDIVNFFVNNGNIGVGEKNRISGIDVSIKSSLRSHKDFADLINGRKLSAEDVENIIRRITATNDRRRLEKWLENEYKGLSKDEIEYISSRKYSDFGRLSEKLLNGIEGIYTRTGERGTVIHFMWATNDNLMQILESGNYTFGEEIKKIRESAFANGQKSVDEKLDDMGISNAVKRSIFRTLDIVSDVVKVEKSQPKKIFVEMTRSNGEKGKRTTSRFKELTELLKDQEDVLKELNSLGNESEANKKLQRKSLYLYFRQLCKCMYCGRRMEISELSESYNIDHIYPQSLVKDDSIHNNMVLVCKNENNAKRATPVPHEYQVKMKGLWKEYLENGLINKTKYDRLTRVDPFSPSEKLGFISRQLVETSQSAKAVATLLKERYPDSEIVYVKAGNVSEFRHQYGNIKSSVFRDESGEATYGAIVKSRTASDIHHAHDAYLNIVVGNVFNVRFADWAHKEDNYSLNFDTLFGGTIKDAWSPVEHLGNVDKALATNSVHLTKYQTMQKGGFFDQMPMPVGSDQLVPRKKGLDIKKYGGYNKPSVSFYVLVKYKKGKKYDLTLLPIRLLEVGNFEKDKRATIERIAKSELGEGISELSLPLGDRIIKVNTVFSLDGFNTCIAGKTGAQILLRSLETPFYGKETIEYIKKIENFSKKLKSDNAYASDSFDGLSPDGNCRLFDELSAKINGAHFQKMPGGKLSIASKEGKEKFEKLDLKAQIDALENMILYLKTNRSGGCKFDGKSEGILIMSANISNWLKRYHDIRIIDRSASGLFETRSENLADLLAGGRS